MNFYLQFKLQFSIILAGNLLPLLEDHVVDDFVMYRNRCLFVPIE